MPRDLIPLRFQPSNPNVRRGHGRPKHERDEAPRSELNKINGKGIVERIMREESVANVSQRLISADGHSSAACVVEAGPEEVVVGKR